MLYLFQSYLCSIYSEVIYALFVCELCDGPCRWIGSHHYVNTFDHHYACPVTKSKQNNHNTKKIMSHNQPPPSQKKERKKKKIDLKIINPPITTCYSSLKIYYESVVNIVFLPMTELCIWVGGQNLEIFLYIYNYFNVFKIYPTKIRVGPPNIWISPRIL